MITKSFYDLRPWFVAFSGMALLCLLIGLNTQCMGLFFIALEQEFRWSRALISGAFSVVRIEGSFLGPIEGFLADKFGPDTMILIGGVITSIGFVILGLVQNPVMFYISLLVITAGVGLGSFIPVTTSVNWWFKKHRNTGLGIAMAGVPAGAALLLPLVTILIEIYNWRTTAYILAAVTFVVSVPLSQVMRKPKVIEENNNSDNEFSDSHAVSIEDDFSLKQAMKTSAFWIIPSVHALNGFTTHAVYVHGLIRLTDAGFSIAVASTVFAVYGFIEILMRVFGSFIGDLIDKRHAIWIFCAIQGLGVVFLGLIPDTSESFSTAIIMAYLFAITFAIGHGGRGPAIVAIRGEYFGRANFGKIMGVGGFITSLTGIITPIALGYYFDQVGDYVIPFIICGLLTAFGGLLILFAKKPNLIKESETN